MPVRIIDLSHHNEVKPDLQWAKNNGIVGVIHKATENLAYVDSKLQARRNLAINTGMLWGVYHFIRPVDPVAQAKFFVKTVLQLGCSDNNTLWAVDHEDAKVPAQDVLKFIKTVEDGVGASPVIYSGHVLKQQAGSVGYINLTQYRLWLAQYAPSPALPPGWDKYFLWQFTDKGVIAGITPYVDMNQFMGTEEELRAKWSGRKSDEPPEVEEPSPKDVTIVIDIDAPPGVKVNVKVTGAGEFSVTTT